MLATLKKILRRNKTTIRLYVYLKRALVYPLRFTALAPVANTTLRLADLVHPRKLLLFAKVAPYTLVGVSGLNNIYRLTNEVIHKKIPGNFVECGVWKGGCAAVMAYLAHQEGGERTTWYFDSFEGMPEPTEKDARGHGKKGDVADITGDALAVSEENVKEVVFEKLKLPQDKNRIIKGWFKDTLPRHRNEIGKIAVLRLDGDWYDSTMDALENLYDSVSIGGYIVIDDYGAWEGCRRAVHDFRDKYKIVMDFKFIGTRDREAYKIDPPAYFKKVNERT